MGRRGGSPLVGPLLDRPPLLCWGVWGRMMGRSKASRAGGSHKTLHQPSTQSGPKVCCGRVDTDPRELALAGHLLSLAAFSLSRLLPSLSPSPRDIPGPTGAMPTNPVSCAALGSRGQGAQALEQADTLTRG